MNVAAALSDDDRLVPFRDCASAVGCSERTLDKRLRDSGVAVVRVSPRQKAVRLSAFRGFLKACEK